jgi:hypothetical protein
VWRAVLGASCFVLWFVLPAAAQMPDPRQMHGRAIPAGELPAGGVTVRVVRQSVGNNVPGVEVALHGAGDVRRATTGADGRAAFTSVPPGSRVQAVAVVDGERLESSTFSVPASGGVRAILVAGLGLGTTGAGQTPAGAAPPASAPPPPAAATADQTRLSFGGNTRMAVEFQDDTIAIFYLLEVVNPTSAPVPLRAPLELLLPEGASGASTLQGASPLVSVSGRRVAIAGPIPPGVTAAPVAYRLESWDAQEEIIQAFPLRVDQVAVGVQRLAGLTVESAQASSIRDAALGGQAFVIASGPALPAGAPLRLALNGLPVGSRWPLYIALSLAAVIAAAGLWLARVPVPRSAEGRRAALQARRDRGLQALAALDRDDHAGRLTPAEYEERRHRLMADLERVYAELDADRVPPGGGRGLAA